MPKFTGTPVDDNTSDLDTPKKGGRFGGSPVDTVSTPKATVGSIDPYSGQYIEGFSQEDVNKMLSESGKGVLSGIGQIVTGIGELLPGEAGAASARATKALRDYGYGPSQVLGALLAPGASVSKAPILAGTLYGLAAPTGEEDTSTRYLEKGLSGVLGGALGGIFGYAPAGYKIAKDTISKALGRDATQAEEVLINKAKESAEKGIDVLSSKEKEQLKLLDQESQRVSTAQKAEQKATQEEKTAAKGLAGTRVQEEFGEYGVVPQTKQEIGNYIRNVYENFVDSVKKIRSSKADFELKGSLDNAANKEASGLSFKNSSGMKNLLSFIDEKLSVETDPALRSQLNVIKKSLFGGEKGTFSADEIAAEMNRMPSSFSNETKRRMAIEALNKREVEQGVVPTFKSSETIRRKIGDAAFGVPEEGYKAIGQNLARDIYARLNNAMKEFEPSFSQYLDRYKRLSETIEASGTKLGKALGATEKDAPAYHATESSLLPDRAFKSADNVKVLVDALGGNKQPVLAAAERYFANQLTGKTADEARKFLTKDTTRSVLNELGQEFKDRINAKYFKTASTQSKRAEAARDIIKTSEDKINTIKTELSEISKKNETLKSGLADIENAVTDDSRRQAVSKLTTKLKSELPPEEYNSIVKAIDDFKKASDDKSNARKSIYKFGKYIGLPGIAIEETYRRTQ